MVLAYYGIEQDKVTLAMECRTDVFGTYPSALAYAAKKFKMIATSKREASWQEIEVSIASNSPVICIVDSGILNQTDKKGNLHMVVVIGVEHKAVVFHDPQDGPARVIPIARFQEAWQANRQEVIQIWRKKK